MAKKENNNKSGKLEARRQKRREEARARNEKCALLSVKERLKLIKSRVGKSEREVKRLMKTKA